MEKTEGWPAGIHEAVAMLRSGGRRPSEPPRGSRRRSSSSSSEECLAALEPGAAGVPEAKLRCSTACAARSATRPSTTTGSATVLDSLTATSVFLVPLDRRGEWFRYHHLCGRACGKSSRRTSRSFSPELHQRAAAWLERRGDSSGALRHAHKPGTTGTSRGSSGRPALVEYDAAARPTVQEWLADLGDDELLSAD